MKKVFPDFSISSSGSQVKINTSKIEIIKTFKVFDFIKYRKSKFELMIDPVCSLRTIYMIPSSVRFLENISNDFLVDYYNDFNKERLLNYTLKILKRTMTSSSFSTTYVPALTIFSYLFTRTSVDGTKTVRLNDSKLQS